MHKSTTLLAPRKPHAVFWRIMQRSAEWEVAVERPVYDLTIFKLQCGKLTLKCYTKGERVLRIDVMAHNTQQLWSLTGKVPSPSLLDGDRPIRALLIDRVFDVCMRSSQLCHQKIPSSISQRSWIQNESLH